MLEHLEHLHETNDLFGNVAKSNQVTESAGINRHIVGDERALQEKEKRLHSGLESCL